jgi:predicted amidohydrolase
MDVRIGAVEDNAARALALLGRAAHEGARLVVLPECALSGYCFASLDEALPYALPATAQPLSLFAERCRELDVSDVIGFLERDAERCWNSAAVLA